jgi:hypothetical protein
MGIRPSLSTTVGPFQRTAVENIPGLSDVRRHGRMALGDRSTPGKMGVMPDTCSHLDTVVDVTPSSEGCEDCLRTGGQWLHLRMCMACGHVGCCDSSPHRHASAHFRAEPDHPIIRSYEPGEDWWWCFVDQLAFEVDGAPPSPSHP